MPIIVIGVVYFVIRIVGKYAGSFLGCLITKKEKTTRNYLGLALIPQAGVAIGLAALGARTIGGEMGNALETIILASSVLYELIGPACAKLSLYLSKSYNQDIIEKQTESVEIHSKINDLVAKINDIQKKLPEHNEYRMSDEEKAFLEAAEEQYGSINYQQKFINKR